MRPSTGKDIKGGFGERGRIRNIGQRLWGINGIWEKGRQKENSVVTYRGPATETTRAGQTQWLSAHICYLTTGGPGKERTTSYHQPEEFGKRSKRVRRHQSIYPTNLPGSSSLESILAERCVSRQEGPWARSDRPETTWKVIPPP